MKNNLLACFLFVSAFVSCSKSNSANPDSNTFHITCAVNGVQKSFPFAEYANITSDSNSTFVDIVGNEDSTFATQITISVTRISDLGNPVPAGSYTITTPGFSTALNYAVAGEDTYLGGSIFDTVSTVTVTNPLHIVITSVDSVGIKGTFSGDVFKDYTTADKMTLTNGDFYVKKLIIP